MRKHHLILSFILLPIPAWAATITGQIQIRVGINTLTGYSGAKIILSTGAGVNTQPVDSTVSDDTGHYTFSDVTAGLKQVTASAPNFKDTTRTVFIRSANRTSTVNLELKRVTGTLSGTVRSNAPDSAGIPNALILSLGMMNSISVVDSVRTDSLGHYSVQLPAGGYEIRISADDFKSTVGKSFLDTTAGIVFDSTTTLNAILAPATSTIAGTIHTSTTTGAPLGGATVYLDRRVGTTAAWMLLDSTLTDVNGIYVFNNLIAASGGTTETSTNYRIRTFKNDTINHIYYGMSATYHSPQVSGNSQALAEGATVIINMAIIVGDDFGAIMPINGIAQNLHFSRLGDYLILNLTASTPARTIQVFDLSGKLQQQVDVRPGESQVFLPARYAPERGFLFLMK